MVGYATRSTAVTLDPSALWMVFCLLVSLDYAEGPGVSGPGPFPAVDDAPAVVAVRASSDSFGQAGLSDTCLLPEVVVGGVRDLGHGACLCGVAFRGWRSKATSGCDPLDVSGMRELVPGAAGGSRNGGQP